MAYRKSRRRYRKKYTKNRSGRKRKMLPRYIDGRGGVRL